MTRGKKIFIGILSILPLLASVFLIIFMLSEFMPTVFQLEREYNGDFPPEVFFSQMIDFIILAIVFGFMQLGLMIYFIVHAINNKRVKNEERIIWVLLFIFVSTIAFPIYWGIRIWPEEKPESNFVKI